MADRNDRNANDLSHRFIYTTLNACFPHFLHPPESCITFEAFRDFAICKSQSYVKLNIVEHVKMIDTDIASKAF